MNNAEKISPVSLCDTGSCAQCPERTGQEVAGPHDRPTRHPDQEIIRSGSATFSFHTAAVSEPTSLYFLSALDARSFRNNLGCAKLRRGSAGRRLLNERDGMGTSTRPEVYEPGMRGLAHSKHRGRFSPAQIGSTSQLTGASCRSTSSTNWLQDR